MTQERPNLDFDYSKYGFHTEEQYIYKAAKGLTEEITREISGMKDEPEWMLKRRLKALELFHKKPVPLLGTWANAELANLDYDQIRYFVRAGEKPQSDWEAVPAEIKQTFERLGIPEAERKFLAGVGAQYECLDGASRVHTQRGLIPIQDVLPGDKVFSFDEQSNQIIPSLVKATAFKGQRVVFEVRVGSRVIKATANHPFLALEAYNEIGEKQKSATKKWKYLHDLVVGDLVATANNPSENGAYELVFAKIDAINLAGVAFVYDLEVEGPHNFLAEGLLVHNSEVVYHSLREEWTKLGVIFLDTDTGLKEYPELFKQYFGTIVPAADNKYAALNTAVWSGGSFIYVPPGVKVDIPLQAYFRINTENMGQFERTLIILDEGAEAHYIEGCFTAGARVITHKGEKAIEQIAVGDEVMTHKGRYRRVYRTMQRPYQGKLYTIRYWGDSTQTLNVTAEHPLFVKRNRNIAPEWVEAKTVQVGDYLVIPLQKPDPQPKEDSRISFPSDENYLYVPIRSIESSLTETEVYNFSVEEDESYVAEGVVSHNCTAPIYSTNSLHSAVVEIIIKKGAKFRYTTIQNWSNNIYNLVTKRAVAYEEASMEWVDGNIGSRLTMKYPAVYLLGRGARGEVLSIAYAGRGQHQDAGAKMVHVAPDTTSRITNKSISKDGGKTTYRGLAKVARGATNAKVNVNCDALILDARSASDTIPYIEIEEQSATLAHEATVGRIGEEQVFYLMSRGLSESEALSMIVLGFIEPFRRELPMEYAVELNRLIEMEMEGSVG